LPQKVSERGRKAKQGSEGCRYQAVPQDAGEKTSESGEEIPEDREGEAEPIRPYPGGPKKLERSS